MKTIVTRLLESYFGVPPPLAQSLLRWQSNTTDNFFPLRHLSYFDLSVPLGSLVMMTLATVLLLLLLGHDYWKTHLTRMSRYFNKLPGARLTIPFIGNAYLHLCPSWKTQEMYSNYFKRHGKVCRFWHFGDPHILICDANVCEKILGSADLFEKASTYDNLRDFGGAGLVTSSGAKWKKDRKALNYAFNRQLFDGFMKIFHHEVKVLLNILETRFQKCPKPQNIYPSFLTAALDMIYQAAVGVKLNAQREGHDNKYSKAINTLLSSSHIRIFKPYIYKTPFVYRLLGKLQAEMKAFDNIYKACAVPMFRKRNEMLEAEANGNQEGKTNKTKPFLDILMEQSPPPTVKEYGEHLVTIIGAGAETTASSIHQTLFFLAHNPEHQKMAHDEVDRIMGPDPDSKELTLFDLSEAKYLEMCWKESIRLLPPVPLIGRKLTRDVKLDDGTILPKDADVVILIHNLHRDPEVFPDPEKFDPLRFTAENSAARSPYSYIPFSAGNRNCIGLKYAHLEAKTTLLHVLSKFKVTTKQKQEDIKVIIGVPGVPYPDIELMLEPRSSK